MVPCLGCFEFPVMLVFSATARSCATLRRGKAEGCLNGQCRMAAAAAAAAAAAGRGGDFRDMSVYVLANAYMTSHGPLL
eukprot:1530447-Amphidinium_carterae.1